MSRGRSRSLRASAVRARRLGIFSAALLILLAPDAALACPVCFSGREENRLAFILTTVFLTVLPLATIGGAVLWLRARWRELERESGSSDL